MAKKCIESEFGQTCTTGGLFPRVKETRDYFTIGLNRVRSILRQYQALDGRSAHLERAVGARYEKEGSDGNLTKCKLDIWFNGNYSGYPYAIKIGCHRYSKETVERAIQEFL